MARYFQVSSPHLLPCVGALLARNSLISVIRAATVSTRSRATATRQIRLTAPTLPAARVSRSSMCANLTLTL